MEKNMLERPRQVVIIGVLSLTLVAGACSRQEPPAGDGGSDRPQPAAAQAGATPSTSAQAPATHEGFLDQVSCQAVSGWAWAPSQPDRPLTIELYDGNRLLKTALADQFRQDLADARKGNGRHVFNETLPPEIKDGKPHSIRAVVKGTSYELAALGDASSPITCAK
jgi:hypothetical protein